MEIPLTSFIDFVLKSGSPKMTSAKKIKNLLGEDYDPRFDYYKRFREAVKKLHQEELDKDDLLKNIGHLPKSKEENYKKMVSGYKKFLGKKDVKWFKPTRESWKHNGINILINPELGLEWNGGKYLIKLYLKSDKPSKDRLSSILALMKHTLPSKDYDHAVLDVRNSKLYLHEDDMDLMIPLVEGEAESLAFILGRL